MITVGEYMEKRSAVEKFEGILALVISRMENVESGWKLGYNAELSVGERVVTLSVPKHEYRVLWTDLNKVLKKEKWVVEFKDIYCNREYRIFDTKKDAMKEYRERVGRTDCGDGDYDIEWVEEPLQYSWEELAEIDASERCWC